MPQQLKMTNDTQTLASLKHKISLSPLFALIHDTLSSTHIDASNQSTIVQGSTPATLSRSLTHTLTSRHTQTSHSITESLKHSHTLASKPSDSQTSYSIICCRRQLSCAATVPAGASACLIWRWCAARASSESSCLCDAVELTRCSMGVAAVPGC